MEGYPTRSKAGCEKCGDLQVKWHQKKEGQWMLCQTKKGMIETSSLGIPVKHKCKSMKDNGAFSLMFLYK